MKNTAGIIILGIVLAAGITACGYFIGQTMYNAKVALNTAEAKGLAERRVMSDRANWKLSFSLAAPATVPVAQLYKNAEENQNKIIAVLKENGFTDNEITAGVIDYGYEEYRDDDQKVVDSKHYMRGSIDIETEKVELVSQVRSKVNKLIAEGVNVQNNPPKYRFTKLNEIKPEMLKEAAQNARVAANEFAQNAGANVGSIRNARQGSFFVRDAGEEYGDTNKIEKDVRVVTTITFYLEN
jgi:hypothetical protein